MEKINKYYCGTGRRKQAVAQVRMQSGSGKIKIVSSEEKAPKTLSADVLEPLKFVGAEKDFDATVILRGGGINAQLQATKLAFAKAIIAAKPDVEKALKKEGFLTRDDREKERKKPGLKRARKAPQWQKR